MNQARIQNNKLEVFTDKREMAVTLMDSLSAFEEGYENSTRYRSGAWDGKHRFFKITAMKEGWYFTIPKGFSKRVQRILGVPVEGLVDVDNKNAFKYLKGLLPELLFRPYRHQMAMALRMMSSNNMMGVAATGSGKSLVFYILLRYFRSQGKKVIFLTPTISLTGQLKDDCKDYNAPDWFMDEIQLLGGDFTVKDIDPNKPMLFSTWQSAEKVDLSQFDVVLNDEVHRSVATVLQRILNNPFEIKLGATGTLPLLELPAMLLEQQFGEAEKFINARQMMNQGLATELTVVPMFLNHGYVKQLKYQDEVKFIKNSIPRREFVTKLLKKLDGLTVALYNHTELGKNTWEHLTGQKLTPKIIKSFVLQKKIGVFFMSGNTPSKVRDEMRRYLTSHNGNVTIIAQKTIMSTGINIKALKNLVFLSSSKSFTEVIQSIGRVLRLHETKSRALIFDLVDDTSTTRKRDNYSLSHFYVRLGYYEQEDFPILEREITL